METNKSDTSSQNETQKEADNNALLTMKETLEQFTEQKLMLSTQLDELRQQMQHKDKLFSELHIENESLKRQMVSLTNENETLLIDIDSMENQLKKVNLIGIEQKRNLNLLELEINRLKERESHTASLEQRLNDSLSENEALKDQVHHVNKSLNELREKHNFVKNKFNALKDRFVDVLGKLRKLKECKRILLETQEEYGESVSKWQNEIILAARQLCKQLLTLKAQNDDLMMKLEGKSQAITGFNLDTIATNLNELNVLVNKALEERLDLLAISNPVNVSEIQKLNFALNQSSVSGNEQNIELKHEGNVQNSDEIFSKEERLEVTSKIQNYAKLEVEFENYKAETLQYIDKLKSEHKNKVEGFEELFEKHILNEQKTISRLAQNNEHELARQALEKLTIEQNQNTKDLQKYRNLYDDLRLKHELKEREHTDLLDEMRELNEALKKRGDLISRQEERQNELNCELIRLQQIENLLKEKEKVIQQKDDVLNQIKEEVKTSQARVKELEDACARSEEQIRIILQDLKQNPNNHGNTNDTIDAVSIASNISRTEELNRLCEVDESFEERYTKLRAFAVKLKKKLQEQTRNANELEEKLREQDIKEETLKELQKHNEHLVAENKKIKASRKQNNVLNLEIEAAEKSLSEVSAKLNAKSSELNELNSVLQTKETTIVQLRKEIAILEAAKSSECEHAMELKTQIDLLQTQIKDAVHCKQISNEANKNLENSVECLKLEIEDLRLQLSQNEKYQYVQEASVREERNQLNVKLAELQSTLARTQSTLKTTEDALNNLRDEYNEYKVKAQAVLRKNQIKDISREQELEDELLVIREKAKELETHAQKLEQTIEGNDKEIEMLCEDNKQQQRRIQELNKIVDDFKLLNEALNREQFNLLQQQQSTLRQQRQQIESIDECHKEQVINLERNHQRQIEQLKLEFSKVSRPPPIIGAVAKQQPDLIARADLTLLEREDAEGSEAANVVTLSSLAAKRKISNASSTRRSQHDFMPLDELINSMNAVSSETLLTANNDFVNDVNISSNSDENSVMERLHVQECRVRHLTALLAENEQDLAKLTQMNDMLKEELRRQERSVEREQHMHNSEYLKNVIIKFLTLNSIDEKTRLVPVLNTILKLSPTETEILNIVAKGQKVAESASRSWTNFLPSWGSSGNGES